MTGHTWMPYLDSKNKSGKSSITSGRGYKPDFVRCASRRDFSRREHGVAIIPLGLRSLDRLNAAYPRVEK